MPPLKNIIRGTVSANDLNGHQLSTTLVNIIKFLLSRKMSETRFQFKERNYVQEDYKAMHIDSVMLQ